MHLEETFAVGGGLEEALALSEAQGAGDAVDLIGVFLFVLYRISMIVSMLRDNNIALAQKVAILEFQLQGLRENREA